MSDVRTFQNRRFVQCCIGCRFGSMTLAFYDRTCFRRDVTRSYRAMTMSEMAKRSVVVRWYSRAGVPQKFTVESAELLKRHAMPSMRLHWRRIQWRSWRPHLHWMRCRPRRKSNHHRLVVRAGCCWIVVHGRPICANFWRYPARHWR